MFIKNQLKNNILLKTIICTGLSTFSLLNASTLRENVAEVLNSNPVIQERLRNFRATQQDLNIAQSEYYPTVDLRLATTYNDAGELNDKVNDIEYKSYESSLTLTQNIFNGFGTIHREDYEEARILAAAYKYIEVSNDVAFKMTVVYLDVIKSNQLLQTARENVQINEEMYSKVRDLYNGGLTTDSEVKKIASSLSLARSNLTVQRNNAFDKEYSFKRVLGRLPDTARMEMPQVNIKMPSNIQRATLYAVKYNPSLKVSNYNIKGAQSLWKQRKKDYYPKVDFVLDQTYNHADPTNNGFDQPDDRFSAKIVLTYNLYRGGADKANVQKHVSMVNQEVDIQRDLKRQVIEGLELSWNAYKMVGAQLVDLKEYSSFSEATLALYKDEYNLGRRTLLDLLTAQNDAINSRSQVIEAEHESLLAKYRILDAMGVLVLSLNGSTNEFTSKVNISNNDMEDMETLDVLPIKLDIDDDKIADNIDLCDNSLKENNIMPYGCIKLKRDKDKDGILDIHDKCPLSKVGQKVNSDGCLIENVIIENNNDGFFNIDGLDNGELTIENILLDEDITTKEGKQ